LPLVRGEGADHSKSDGARHAGLVDQSFLALARVDYRDGGSETYVLAVAAAHARRARRIAARQPRAVIATAPSGELLHDALVDRDLCRSLLDLFRRRRRRRGGRESSASG